MTSIVGGKLTTYRQMAEEAVDHICARLGVTAPCQTKATPLVGATSRRRIRELSEPLRLIKRYGAEATAVMAIGSRDKSLLRPIAGQAGAPRFAGSAGDTQATSPREP